MPVIDVQPRTVRAFAAYLLSTLLSSFCFFFNTNCLFFLLRSTSFYFMPVILTVACELRPFSFIFFYLLSSLSIPAATLSCFRLALCNSSQFAVRNRKRKKKSAAPALSYQTQYFMCKKWSIFCFDMLDKKFTFNL